MTQRNLPITCSSFLQIARGSLEGVSFTADVGRTERAAHLEARL
jgi:hypothetical protein